MPDTVDRNDEHEQDRDIIGTPEMDRALALDAEKLEVLTGAESRTERNHKAANDLLSWVGGARPADLHEFLEVITVEHRTIQQSLGRLVVELIERWADNYRNERFDLRNASTVEFANLVVTRVSLNDRLLPYI